MLDPDRPCIVVPGIMVTGLENIYGAPAGGP